MQGEDSLDNVRDAGGRAAELAEETPGLEGGDGLPGQGPDLRVGPVDGLLACGQRLPPAAAGNTDRTPGSSVSLVGPADNADPCESVDDTVLAGRADVMDSPGQSGRRPQQPAERIGDDPRSSCWTGRCCRPAASCSFGDAARTASARAGARAARTSTASAMQR